MRIMDVQEFKSDQYSAYKERRTSQFTRFLDKTVDFVTYYSINKAISTGSVNNLAADSYIGADSPIRYNKINNMPIYGFPIIGDQNGYDEENAGLTGLDFEGEIIVLQDIIEPVEGDCFILNIFSERYFFRVTEVKQIVLRSKPHYNVSFMVGHPDYLEQLNKQVVEEYNAIFDNIGTQDRVIISANEYDLRKQFEKIYKEISDYYIARFFDPKITMFELSLPMSIRNSLTKYTDKFLIRFMESNRIITFDSLLKTSFVLDYNSLGDTNDFIEYKKSIFWAIENKTMTKFIPAKFVEAKKIVSPFTLLKGQTDEECFVADKYCVDEPTDNAFFFEYDYSAILQKWNADDTYEAADNPYDKALTIIVKYMKGIMMMPGYFADMIGEMNPVQEYTMLPIMLFIIREQIKGLMTTKISI